MRESTKINSALWLRLGVERSSRVVVVVAYLDEYSEEWWWWGELFHTPADDPNTATARTLDDVVIYSAKHEACTCVCLYARVRYFSEPIHNAHRRPSWNAPKVPSLVHDGRVRSSAGNCTEINQPTNPKKNLWIIRICVGRGNAKQALGSARCWNKYKPDTAAHTTPSRRGYWCGAGREAPTRTA